MSWLTELFSKKSPTPEEPEKAVEERVRPPILLRIGPSAEQMADTTAQFLAYGWRKGKSTLHTAPIEYRLFKATEGHKLWNTVDSHLVLPTGDLLRAVSIESREESTYVGRCSLLLYITHDTVLAGVPYLLSYLGVPSQELLEVVQQVALSFESQIRVIENDGLGNVMVLFAPRNQAFTLGDFTHRWNKMAVANWENVDGSVDNSTGSVEGG